MRLLLSIVLTVSATVGFCQNYGFQLELKNLLPCQEIPERSDVSLYRSDILAVQADFTLCENSSWVLGQYNVS